MTDQILDAVKNFGFPAVCCYLLLRQQEKQNKFYQDYIMEMKNTIDGVTRAINSLNHYIRKKGEIENVSSKNEQTGKR